MSTFSCPLVTIKNVRPHPNADQLELVDILGFTVVSGKDIWKQGDTAIYIPEAAILPKSLIEFLNLEGKLAGPEKNRVKAIRLRGKISIGILCPVEGWPGSDSKMLPEIGFDAAPYLGVTKYEPPVPVNMAGELFSLPEYALKYDIENLRRYPETFQENEKIHVSEKLHGTFFGILYVPNFQHPNMIDAGHGSFTCFSKGLGSQGLFMKNNEANANNVYLKTLKSLLTTTYLDQKISRISENVPVYILGEIYGKGIQDLTYGTEKPDVRFFDMKINGNWLDIMDLIVTAQVLELRPVCYLYSGHYDKSILDRLATGQSVFDKNTVREGIVIRPDVERYHPLLGRVILKHINPDYLTRKGTTTEFT